MRSTHGHERDRCTGVHKHTLIEIIMFSLQAHRELLEQPPAAAAAAAEVEQREFSAGEPPWFG